MSKIFRRNSPVGSYETKHISFEVPEGGMKRHEYHVVLLLPPEQRVILVHYGSRNNNEADHEEQREEKTELENHSRMHLGYSQAKETHDAPCEDGRVGNSGASEPWCSNLKYGGNCRVL